MSREKWCGGVSEWLWTCLTVSQGQPTTTWKEFYLSFKKKKFSSKTEKLKSGKSIIQRLGVGGRHSCFLQWRLYFSVVSKKQQFNLDLVPLTC